MPDVLTVYDRVLICRFQAVRSFVNYGTSPHRIASR
jgi:hypothetical protein